jgi:hypothetical protein
LNLADAGLNGRSMEYPALIDDIQWFGTTTDICQVMLALKDQDSEEVFEILGQKTPFLDEGEGNWLWAGFKGGAEPGLMSAAYLLQDQEGVFSCLSMVWHDETKDVNHVRFFDLIQKILDFLATAN